MTKIVRGMTKIVEGVRIFQNQVFSTKVELFQKLGKGQSPLVLFITCSDSRINPNLLTQTEPGELFLIRNAGNIIPAFGAGGGEEATIEYAVAHLKVRHIVVCGHTNCGAMAGLLEPKSVEALPSVARWLAHSQAAAAAVQALGQGISPQERLRIVTEKNVLLQLEHLQAHPAVQKPLAAGELKLHGWIYDFAVGDVRAHDSAEQRFVSLALKHLPHPPRENEANKDQLPTNCI